MADITLRHRAAQAAPASMDHPRQWHYVATPLMAHMGAYSSDEMNGLHWLWHQRAALRIRTAMQRHNIWPPQAPGEHGPKRSRDPPVRQHDITPQDATRGRHPGWVPPLARTEAPSDRSPHGGTEATLTPQGCGATRGSGTRRQGTLGAPDAAAARRLRQHGESSSMRAWTEAMEVQTTRTPKGHRLPTIPDAGPRGPAMSGRTSQPFPHQPSERDRQRSTQTPTRQQTVCPARPLPPSQGGGPARCRGTARRRQTAKGTPGRPTARTGGGGTNPSTPPPASRARQHRSRTWAPATRPTGPVHHGAPHPRCNTTKPPGRGGRTRTTGARRGPPRSGRRNDRNLRPSGIQ